MQSLVADTELEEGASYELHFAALYCTRLQLSPEPGLETRDGDPAIRCQCQAQVGRGEVTTRRISDENISLQLFYTLNSIQSMYIMFLLKMTEILTR